VTRRIRHSRNSGGSLWLFPLPGGLGLNIGRGFSGFASVRSWEWARFDFADHEPLGSERWAAVQLSKSPDSGRRAFCPSTTGTHGKRARLNQRLAEVAA
jgi:hypothetical protein